MDRHNNFEFFRMPNKWLFNLFDEMDHSTLRESRVVSKSFKLFADSDFVWKHRTKRLLGRESESNIPVTSAFREYFFSQVKCWSPTNSSDGMIITAGNRQVRSGPTVTDWATAVVEFPQISKSKVYCEFVIESFVDGYLNNTEKVIIGVIPEDFQTTRGKHVGESQSYGYIASSGKKIGSGGTDAVAYAQPYGQGDRIGVLADPIANELTFFKNGESMGVAFTNFMDTRDGKQYKFAASVLRAGFQIRTLPSVRAPSEDAKPQALERVVACNFPLSSSPRDIQLAILSKLGIHDIIATKKTCKVMANVASSDFLWIPIAERLLGEHYNPQISPTIAFKNGYRRFSETVKVAGLELSDDRLTVTSTSAVTYWAAVRFEYPAMNSGVHYAEFKINTYRHASIGNTWKIVCGIVSDEFEYALTKWVGIDQRSFGYIAENGKIVGPDFKNLGFNYSQRYQEHDRIGVLVDFHADQITFYKNGVNLGVAFDGFSKQSKWDNPNGGNYYFAVSLARWGMSISSIPDARCPDRDLLM